MIQAVFTTLGQMTVVLKDTPTPIVTNIGNPIEISANIALIGPQGPKGDTADPSTIYLGQLADVQITSANTGDILVYDTNKFINAPKQTLVDGGNF